MSNKVISAADLSFIERNLNVLANNVKVVAQRVDSVGHNVEVVYSELNSLSRKFEQFVAQDAVDKALAVAESRIIKSKQQLKEEFGYYDEVRRHTTGILQATDIRVVRKETISKCTEELMLSAPRYWLAPCLIALAAWINDDRDLAERALKEAMRRDDEKTSLLFALISRRAGRYNGCLTWLERYFSMQDPSNLERKMIVVLDAFACGLFGPDSKGLCAEKIKNWIDELSAKPGFTEVQKSQWQQALRARTAAVDENAYPYLIKHSSTWPQLKYVMAWASTHSDIYEYFSTIFGAMPASTAGLNEKIDSLLDSLTTNYDNEELPLRRELRRNELIVEENGHVDRASVRFDAEEKAFEERVDFSQHLTNVSMNPESFGVQQTTQKLAISLSKEWLMQAYEDLTIQSRAKSPLQIELKLDDWTASTKDGTNEIELVESLNLHITDKLNTALVAVKLNALHWFALGGGGLLGLYGLVNVGILPMVIGVGGMIYYYIAKKNLTKKKDQIISDFEQYRENAITILRAILAEVVDYRREYAQRDAEYGKVIDFMQQLSPQQYIVVGDRNIRQVI